MVIFFEITAGLVRRMQRVRQQQLQRVFAGRQRQRGFGLALAEVDVVSIGGQRQRKIGGRIGVEDQVMVPGVVELDAGGRDAHALQAEHHGDRSLDLRAVLRRNDVDLGAGGRWGAIGERDAVAARMSAAPSAMRGSNRISSGSSLAVGVQLRPAGTGRASGARI